MRTLTVLLLASAISMAASIGGVADAHEGGRHGAPRPPAVAKRAPDAKRPASKTRRRSRVRARAAHGAGWPAHGDVTLMCHTFGYHGFEATAGYVGTFSPSGQMNADASAPFGARYSTQYVYFRVWAGWTDAAGQWKWSAGSWVRSRGGSGGGTWERQLADGRWVYTANGDYFAQGTSFTTLPVSAAYPYYIYGEYYWGPITDWYGRTVFSGAGHMEPRGYARC